MNSSYHSRLAWQPGDLSFLFPTNTFEPPSNPFEVPAAEDDEIMREKIEGWNLEIEAEIALAGHPLNYQPDDPETRMKPNTNVRLRRF